MKKVNYFLLTLALSITCKNILAQTISTKKQAVSLVFGLNQPLVTNGFNFEINYWTKNFIFDYSHGFGLQIRNILVSEESKKQSLDYNIKHSLGLGFGYRLTSNFNIRIEPKLHVWDIYYNDKFKVDKIATYNTWTLGLGAYYNWQPFIKHKNLLKGITIAPNIRWWPNIASSLPQNKFSYFNEKSQKIETIMANNIGISNSPLFANMSIGYTFGNR